MRAQPSRSLVRPTEFRVPARRQTRDGVCLLLPLDRRFNGRIIRINSPLFLAGSPISWLRFPSRRSLPQTFPIFRFSLLPNRNHSDLGIFLSSVLHLPPRLPRCLASSFRFSPVEFSRNTLTYCRYLIFPRACLPPIFCFG